MSEPYNERLKKIWRRKIICLQNREAKKGFQAQRRMLIREMQLLLNLTKHEQMVWNLLNHIGASFSGQKGIFIDGQIAIVDFLVDGWLVIEIDGSSHNNHKQSVKDALRDAHCAEKRYRVIRLTNKEVETLTAHQLITILYDAADPPSRAPDELIFTAHCRDHY